MRVWQAVAAKENGFTMIEALLALAAAMAVAAVVPALLSVRLLAPEPTDAFSRLEWRLFLQQLQIELNEAKKWSTDGRVLYLHKWNGETVSFSLVAPKAELIRQVNGAGYETALRHVRAVSYRIGAHGLFLQVTADDGKVCDAFVARAF
ncbi:competence type IV pilus minor pilin ComGF [Anoxybacillus geothermalis]|nr:competence protein ComGF [Geobacillus stearothermophilus]MED5072834.1 competence type IV pilus minor pilin ComGF [Anoxybacillus geothermalis]QOR83359.1 ComGF family competence protein [Geobacillus stearothermophilus]